LRELGQRLIEYRLVRVKNRDTGERLAIELEKWVEEDFIGI
jgi:hypothetical protein